MGTRLAGVMIGIALAIHVPRIATAGDRPVEGEAAVSVSRNVPYTDDSDSIRVADIYEPEGEGPFPGIVMIHGGGWIAGDKLFDAMHARRLAASGYVVMVINYRLAPAHKHPAQVDDCFEAIRWLVHHADDYRVDGDRIGVWGYSAGGHLAALVATNPRSGIPRVKACVAGGAPCDLRLIPDDSTVLAGFLGGTRMEIPEVYDSASPVHHVSQDDPPMLLFHGDADGLVPMDFAKAMCRRLEEQHVVHEFLPLENKTHIMAFVDREAIRRSIAFLDRHLKGAAAAD